MNNNKFLWRKIYLFYVALMIIIFVIGTVTLPMGSTKDKGGYVFYPLNNSIVGNKFNVNGSIYSLNKDSKYFLNIKNTEDNTIKDIPVIQKDVVMPNGDIVKRPAFSSNVRLDKNGEYLISLRIVDKNSDFKTKPMNIKVSDCVKHSRTFRPFSRAHKFTFIIVILFILLLLSIVKNISNSEVKLKRFELLICVVMMVSDIVGKTILLNKHIFCPTWDLAWINLCGLLTLLIPISFFAKNSKIRTVAGSVVGIVGVIGPFLAMILPDLTSFGVGSSVYNLYFIKHALLWFSAIYLLITGKITPSFKNIFTAIIFVSVYVFIIVYPINLLLSKIPPYDFGNYFYFMYPPAGVGGIVSVLMKYLNSPIKLFLGYIFIACVLILMVKLIHFIIKLIFKYVHNI